MKNIQATPKVRKYARENGISLENIKGTGEYDSVVFSDVLRLKRTQRASSVALKMAKYYNINIEDIAVNDRRITKEDVLYYANIAKVEPVGEKRRVIAQKMLNSIHNAAQYTLFAQLDTTKLFEEYRNQKRQLALQGTDLHFIDVLIQKVSKCLLKNSKLNSAVIADKIYRYNYVNMALAVDCPDGLMAPVLKGVNLKSLEEIAKLRGKLVEKARTGRIHGEDLEGGTFTLTNLGQSPVGYFTPIINYPEVAILGVGKSEKKPVVCENEIVIRTMTHFSLTMDHVLLDGMDGACFFKDLEEIIQ